MKKKTGFTLIELLAVIVILAVIALIATPLIMGVIEDAKKGSYRDSLHGIVKAAENYQMKLVGTTDEKEAFIEFPTNILDVKGNDVSEGYLAINKDGRTSFMLGNGTYCAVKDFATEDINVMNGTCDTQTPKECFVVSPSGTTINEYLCDGKHDGYKKITEIIIPKQIVSGVDVTTIGGPSLGVGAFKSKELTSVYLPITLTEIMDSGFRYNKIKQIIIPNRMKIIQEDSFQDNQIANLFISKSVLTIGEYAFSRNLLPDNQAIIYARNADGSENKKIIASYGGKNTETVEIPDGVEEIRPWGLALINAKKLILPDSLGIIGTYGFSENKITDIIIPKNVVTIGTYALNTSPTQTVTFMGNTPPTMQPSTFHANKSLQTIYVPVGTKAAYFQALKICLYDTGKYITEDMIVER